ncbi:DnaB-like helicase C-terminal domain-containing protein [Virgibacillus siamensis]|uniref:DnaB-like helicase C-terminal domain-containing protein n=1 Tax=Virgibacillus siamensis TaxID=480071 RepID=UPI0009845CBE|nr:DnaB-like helicase C-terminal domain-containing protein [Virgibacillus siamensis]
MQNNFEIIKDKVQLFGVLDDELDLKKSGRVYKTNCPFHDERTPSFTYFPETDTYHCFGCGSGGTVVDYVMQRESIKEPYEAVEYMADKHNIQLAGFDKEVIKRKKDIVKKNRSTALEHYKNVKQAESFLLDRGFNQETIKKFGIGFNMQANAITIPYLDTYGNVVGETYRNLDDDKPKYVNSKEDDVFKKSELLFGLDKARKHIKDKVFISEGYFDAIALYQMGYKESVAFCGSYLTDGQANLLSKYMTKRTKIYLIPDNDKTGLKNVSRNIKTLRTKVSNPISVIRFPDGIKDANDVLQLGQSIDRFGSEHHELFMLKQELEVCLEQVDEYEVAKKFVKYTQNKMIRAEMADYLAERWNKSKSLVLDYMETEEATIDKEKDLQSFSDIRDKFKKQALEGVAAKVFFNLQKPDEKVKGMKKTEVAYMLGRAGSGKTTFVLNFIHNIVFKQEKNVMFNSLELDGANIAPQLLQIHFDQTEEEVTKMVLNDEPALEPIYEKLDRHFKTVDRSGQSLQDVENYALMCKEAGEPLDVIFIDYFSYLKRPMRNSSYEEFSAIAREIKQMAKRLNVLVFVLAQTNRSGTDGSEPLTMDAARDTGAIEESGDYVLGVYRPAAKAEVTEEEKQANPDFEHEYFLQYLKNRWGGVGKDKLHFDPKTKRITDFKDYKKRVYYGRAK